MNASTAMALAVGAVLGVLAMSIMRSLVLNGSSTLKKTRRSARSLWNWIAVAAMVTVMVMAINAQQGGTP